MSTGDPMCPSCGRYLSSHRYECCQNTGHFGPVVNGHIQPGMLHDQERISFLEKEFLRVDDYAKILEAQVTYLQTISTEQVTVIRHLQAMLRVAHIKSMSPPLVREQGGYNVC